MWIKNLKPTSLLKLIKVNQSMINKWLISKIHKELTQLDIKKQTTQLKNGQTTGTDISPKIYRWSTGTRNVQYQESSEKHSSKPQ